MVYGNAANLNLTVSGGITQTTVDNLINITSFSIGNVASVTSLRFGGNQLTAGSGNSDLFGNNDTTLFNVSGGQSFNDINYVATSIPTTAGSYPISLLNTTAAGSIVFEGNVLRAMNGAGDHSNLYGNMNTLILPISGAIANESVSTAENGNKISITNHASGQITFGANTLVAGDGNDTLYGNMNTFILPLSGSNLTAAVDGHLGAVDISANSADLIQFSNNTCKPVMVIMYYLVTWIPSYLKQAALT